MKIAIGGANISNVYGIGSTAQDADSLAAVLGLCLKHKISLIDSSPAYGNSEFMLGKVHDGNFEFISKFSNHYTAAQSGTSKIRTHVETSTANLRINKLHSLLFHDSQDLSGPEGQKLFEEAQLLRDEGLVTKIGVSIYSPSELDVLESAAILSHMDVVQAPLNIFDRRMNSSGWLVRLQARRVEFHARSIFLQGLLLRPIKDLPEQFSTFQPALKRYHDRLSRERISPLEACISLLHNIGMVDVAVVGVDNVIQLAEIIEAHENPKEFDARKLELTDLRLIDPRNWL